MPVAGQKAPTQEELDRRRLEALKLRKAGHSYAEIGEALGISANQAHHDVHHEIRKLNKELRDETADVRELELTRLDNIVKVLQPKVDLGNEDSIEIYLKVMNRRAKLLGLDAASKQEIEVNDNRDKARRLSDAEAWERVKALRERLEATGRAKRHPIQDERNPFLLEQNPIDGEIVYAPEYTPVEPVPPADSE